MISSSNISLNLPTPTTGLSFLCLVPEEKNVNRSLYIGTGMSSIQLRILIFMSFFFLPIWQEVEIYHIEFDHRGLQQFRLAFRPSRFWQTCGEIFFKDDYVVFRYFGDVIRVMFVFEQFGLGFGACYQGLVARIP